MTALGMRRGRVRVTELGTSGVGAAEIIERRPPGWRPWLGLACVVALLVVSMWAQVDRLGAATGLQDLPRLEVPPVDGLDANAAQARLEDLGFVVDVQLRPNEDPTKPKGMAFGQVPPAGAKVEQGDSVTVVVSDGPAGVTVPALAGQQVVDAQALLLSSGMNSTVTEVFDDVVRPGEIIATLPEAGQRVPIGGVVALTASKGPAPRTVPPIPGRDLNSVLVDLGRSGLGVGAITRKPQEGTAAGTVLSSDPPSGGEVPRDTPVKLTVVGDPPDVPVPSLVGLRTTTADSLLKQKGFSPDIVARPVSAGDATAGRVIGQGVPPYARVRPGSRVQITVGAPT